MLDLGGTIGKGTVNSMENSLADGFSFTPSEIYPVRNLPRQKFTPSEIYPVETKQNFLNTTQHSRNSVDRSR